MRDAERRLTALDDQSARRSTTCADRIGQGSGKDREVSVFVKRFEVCNFMIHRRTAVYLYPLTLFVGPNNSGKSSLFDALLNLSRVCTDPIREAFPAGPYSYRSRHHHGEPSDEPIRFNVELTVGADSDTQLAYDLAYRQTDWVEGRAHYEIVEECVVEHPAGEVVYDRESSTLAHADVSQHLDRETTFFAALRKLYLETRARPSGLLGHAAANLSRVGKYRLDPTLLSRPAPLPETLAPAGGRLTPPRMRYLGEGLASVLYYLDRTRDPQLDQIVDGVASAIEGFSGFEFNAISDDLVGFSARFSDSRGAVEAPNLSAGTLSLIGWITLLRRGDRQPVLLLEEPELGLTPRSAHAIYEAALAASGDPDERSQLLIASHSPALLSWVASDCGPDRAYIFRAAEGAAEALTYEQVPTDGAGFELARAVGVDAANQVMHGF
jgi:hypothetical protein